MEKRGRGHAAGLELPVILAAASGLLAERGSSGLSMRAIAARLGVAPNALYNHVANRTDLIDALLDDALGEVRAVKPGPPRDELEEIMLSSYDALTARRALVPLYLERRGARGPNAIALGERMREALDALGIDDDRTRRITHSLIVQVIGFAAYGPTTEPGNRIAYLDSLSWTLDGALADSPPD
jgi:TetR/AcrR family tetracycline transcriptional repressor